MGYCCVPCCKSTQTKGLSFHKFPTSIESKRQWIVAISRQGNPRGCHWTPKGRSTVCSKHFKDSDYSISTTKKILLPNAVPSIFEDLVGRKKAWRVKASSKLQSESDTSEIKESATMSHGTPTVPEESVIDGLPEAEKTSRKRGVVKEERKLPKTNGKQSNKARKIRRVKSTIPSREEEEEIPETAMPSAEETSESAILHDVETTSDNSSLPITDETSETGSECGERKNESAMDMNILPHSTTIKISKNLQLVLRKLVTTIEDQRAEISKLKRERDLLNRQVYDLKNQQVQHHMLHHTKNL